MRRAFGLLVQPRRCGGPARQPRAPRTEKLEEDGQYGWWPALEGEQYRSKLKTVSVSSPTPDPHCSVCWCLCRAFDMCANIYACIPVVLLKYCSICHVGTDANPDRIGVHVCVRVYMRVCMCVCVCVRICACTCL